MAATLDQACAGPAPEPRPNCAAVVGPTAKWASPTSSSGSITFSICGRRGSSGVVASLWKVDDQATAEFMKVFYKGMLQGKLGPAAALRQREWR